MGSNFSHTKSKQLLSAVGTTLSFFTAVKKALMIRAFLITKSKKYFFNKKLDAAMQWIYILKQTLHLKPAQKHIKDKCWCYLHLEDHTEIFV